MKATDISYWIYDKECCDLLAIFHMSIDMGNIGMSVLWLSFLMYILLTWDISSFSDA